MLEKTFDITIKRTNIERVAKVVTRFFLPEGSMLFVAGRQVPGIRHPNEILGFHSYNPDHQLVLANPSQAGELNPDFKVICETEPPEWQPSNDYHIAIDPRRIDPLVQTYLTKEGLEGFLIPMRFRIWDTMTGLFEKKFIHLPFP